MGLNIELDKFVTAGVATLSERAIIDIFNANISLENSECNAVNQFNELYKDSNISCNDLKSKTHDSTSLILYGRINLTEACMEVFPAFENLAGRNKEKISHLKNMCPLDICDAVNETIKANKNPAFEGLREKLEETEKRALEKNKIWYSLYNEPFADLNSPNRETFMSISDVSIGKKGNNLFTPVNTLIENQATSQ